MAFHVKASITSGATLSLLLPIVLATACGGDDTASIGPKDGGSDVLGDSLATPDSPTETGTADGGVDAPADAAPDARADGPITTGTGYFRVAHLSSDAPAFDVCLSTRSQATDFAQSSPLLKAKTPAGVAFGQTTTYQAADPGTYGLRYVAPGATDCATALGAIKDASLTLVAQQFVSVVVGGSYAADAAANPFGATAFVDDPITAALGDGGGGAALRVIHEAVGVGTVDVGTGSLVDGDFVVMYPLVRYGATASPGGAIDARGYYFPAIVNGTTLSVHLDGATADLAVWTALTVDNREVGTLFLATPTAQKPIRGVLCARDYAQNAQSALNATCVTLP